MFQFITCFSFIMQYCVVYYWYHFFFLFYYSVPSLRIGFLSDYNVISSNIISCFIFYPSCFNILLTTFSVIAECVLVLYFLDISLHACVFRVYYFESFNYTVSWCKFFFEIYSDNIVVEMCGPNPCQNDGKCTPDGDDFTCDCTNTGYTGDTCEIGKWLQSALQLFFAAKCRICS